MEKVRIAMIGVGAISGIYLQNITISAAARRTASHTNGQYHRLHYTTKYNQKYSRRTQIS